MRRIVENVLPAYIAHPAPAGMRAIPQGVIGGDARAQIVTDTTRRRLALAMLAQRPASIDVKQWAI